ncbi:Catalase/peroxidase HPI [Phytophthora cinnamomi]|uniref:Catalase/peroxidase HPI n=1 Tax=Phytophthora cinnamomi TaxID=4785 RepID=UPI00355AA6B0|nr:Catalase/peroxidase HPI [Phytophthora cinnamomi]
MMICQSTQAEGKDVYMMDTDLALPAAPELNEAVQLFASVECIFKHVFSSAVMALLSLVRGSVHSGLA